jgi:hypothetical protein
VIGAVPGHELVARHAVAGHMDIVVILPSQLLDENGF